MAQAIWLTSLGAGRFAQLQYPADMALDEAADLLEWLAFAQRVLQDRHDRKQYRVRQCIESPESVVAVDPVASNSVDPTPREKA